MASIDPSQQSLSAILNKLGINSAEKSNVPKSKDQLGQEDFLKLMTTQLQNQDPFCTYGKWRVYCANGSIFNCNWNN